MSARDVKLACAQWVRELADSIREARVLALFLALAIAWRVVGWVTAADPAELGGTAVATIYTGTAALVAGVAAIARRKSDGNG